MAVVKPHRERFIAQFYGGALSAMATISELIIAPKAEANNFVSQ